MPSTYSTNLKLQLMATGEDNGTWGDNTNNNLGTLLEEAIIGAGTVAMADSNQTITIPNGVTSTGRKVYITCTGALSANRNLVVPTSNKNYVVENATTGGFSIVVKTTAGTGITVGPGLKRYVYADGTNVVEAINSVGDLTIAGTLGTIGALTVTGAVTAGTFNKYTLTTPATGATLTIVDGKTFTASNTLTLTGTDGTSFAFPSTSDTVVTLTGTQTLTNKTLTTAALGSSTATTQPAGTSNTTVATTAFVAAAVTVGMPPGAIIPYGGSSAPSGWLFCDGASYATAAQPTLFAAIDYAYGGSGANFNVPDLRGRVVAGRDDMGGSAAGRLTATTMSPDGITLGATGGTQTHTHTATTNGPNASTTVNGAGGTGAPSSGHGHDLTTNASSSVQPTLILNYIIKA